MTKDKKEVTAKEAVADEISTQFESRKPDYRGNGVAVWMNFDKYGNRYLAVKILGNIVVPCFLPKADRITA